MSQGNNHRTLNIYKGTENYSLIQASLIANDPEDLTLTPILGNNLQGFQLATPQPSVAGPSTVTKTGKARLSKTWHPTASELRMQRTPLSSHLLAKEILEKDSNRLYYNNILKVGLTSRNCEIADKLLVPDGVRNVTRRINTAVGWIESELKMDRGAFHYAYHRERKLLGIWNYRYDSFNETILAANANKINDAMIWIKRGGPRSVAFPLASHAPRSEPPEIVVVDLMDVDSGQCTFPDPHL